MLQDNDMSCFASKLQYSLQSLDREKPRLGASTNVREYVEIDEPIRLTPSMIKPKQDAIIAEFPKSSFDKVV